MEEEKASLSVEIDKDVLLKFKSMCVLREHTMAEEIEKMISDWVSLNESPGQASPNTADKNPEDTTKGTGKPAGQPPKEETSGEASGGEDLSDELEEQAEKS
jgi:hypothetical protein